MEQKSLVVLIWIATATLKFTMQTCTTRHAMRFTLIMYWIYPERHCWGESQSTPSYIVVSGVGLMCASSFKFCPLACWSFFERSPLGNNKVILLGLQELWVISPVPALFLPGKGLPDKEGEELPGPQPGRWADAWRDPPPLLKHGLGCIGARVCWLPFMQMELESV